MWLRPRVAVAAAAALIRPLAWKLPFATGVALKNKKEEEEEENVTCLVTLLLY